MVLTAQPPKFTVTIFHFLSYFNLRTIWKWYESFAVYVFSKYKNSLEANKENVKNYTIANAKKELKKVDSYINWLEKYKPYFEIVKDEKPFVKFYAHFLEAYYALSDIQEALENKVYPHYYAQASEKALAKAWNSPEDEHWDNY